MEADLDDYTNNERILKTAGKILEKARDRNIHKRQGMDRTAEAAVKIAARQEQELLEDPSKMEYFPGRGLEPGVRKIARYIDEYAPPYGAKLYLTPFMKSEAVKDNIIERAEKVIEDSSDSPELIGKSNTAGAAAAVYVASVLEDEYISIDKIIEISEISEPTLRNSYVPMVEAIEKEEKFLENHPYPSRTTWG